MEGLDRRIGQRRDATRAPNQARSGWRPSGRLMVSPLHHLRTHEILSKRWGPPHSLPSRLPSIISEKKIQLAWGEVRKDGYFISLYYSDPGSNADYAAGFGASMLISRDLGRRVGLSGGRIGMFRPVSCGGSCAPANLWWEQNGVLYQIQIKLRSDLNEKDQEKILVDTANLSVTALRD